MTKMAEARRALVLGGSGYLGQAVVEALSARGVEVAFTFNEGQDQATALCERCPNASAHQVELRDEAQVRALTRALLEDAPARPPSIFIHCATLARWLDLADVTSTLWGDTMSVCVSSAFWVAQELAAALKAAGLEGDFIFPMAVNGVMSVPAPIPFGAAQGARQGLMRALAKELGRDKIRVNAVTFGPLDGGISAQLEPQLIKDYKHFSSLGRTGTAQEAAALITWLALENDHIAGATLSADGGL